MAIDYKNPLEFIKFIGYLAPFLMTFIVSSITLFNGQPLKGFIYIGSVLILSVLIISLTHVFKIPMSKSALYGCRMFGMDTYSVPSLSSAIMAFNFVYLWWPAYSTPNAPPASVPLLMFLISMYLINGFVKFTSACTDLVGILSGTIAGMVFAFFCVTMARVSSKNANSQLLLFSEVLINKEICTRPSETKFNCKLYKDGQEVNPGNQNTVSV